MQLMGLEIKFISIYSVITAGAIRRSSFSTGGILSGVLHAAELDIVIIAAATTAAAASLVVVIVTFGIALATRVVIV